jgi:cell division inhibitor SulA
MSINALRDHVHFALSMERAVRLANREVMVSMIGTLTEEQLVYISMQIAKTRAAYVMAALKIGLKDASAPSASELKKLREDFEEKRDAFSAVMTAIERGYLDDPETKSD